MKAKPKSYMVRVTYRDRRDGPCHWTVRLQAGSICVAIGRGVREFWRWHGWRGREPARFLTIIAERVGA